MKEIVEKSATIGTWVGVGFAVICAIILFFDGRIGAGIGMLLLGTLLFALAGWIIGLIIENILKNKTTKVEEEVAANISRYRPEEHITLYNEIIKKNEAILQEPYPESDGQRNEPEELKRIHLLLCENFVMNIMIKKTIIYYKRQSILLPHDDEVEDLMQHIVQRAIGTVQEQSAELESFSEKLLALPIVKKAGMYDDWAKKFLKSYQQK
jgi:hypothetical protein